ncbi:MAG TPA: hypothetical protein VE129_02595 [Thermoanaerobaculia bacterium]|nr:hypothetical protein [Thermoanaerobaculia bacterium]
MRTNGRLPAPGPALTLVRAALLVPLLLGALPAPAQPVRNGPLPEPLPLFPADNWWNADVSAAPRDPNEAAILAFIGASKGLHPDFGGDASESGPDIYGMPYLVVPGSQPLEPVAFDYADESDDGAPGRPTGYPIPVEVKTQAKWLEGGSPGNSGAGGDKHLLIVDRDNRLLFETWNTRCEPQGSSSCTWRAGSGAVFPLDSNLRRPDGWTSADAAGLAVLPGLVRYDEAFGSGPIRHAFRFTTRATNGYVFPASHRAGSTNGAPPLGTRLRLKASRDLSGFPAPVQRIFQAMKSYGLILADNGSDMYVQGTYDTRWDNDVLNPAFASLKVSDFEVVQLGWIPTGLPTDPCESGPGPSCNEWLLPSSARIGGEGGAFYTTDLTVVNTGVTEARLFVRFLGHDADGRSGADRPFLLAAGRSVTYADVLGSLFGLGEAWGAVQLRSASPSLVATSQTWTPGAGGTFGQSVPLISETELIRGGTARTIPAVREDASFRTNLILANGTATPVDVDVSLVSEGGTVLGSRRWSLLPLGMTQVSRVVKELGIAGIVSGARLVLSTPTSGGTFAAYASVIDAKTNDPRTLLPR